MLSQIASSSGRKAVIQHRRQYGSHHRQRKAVLACSQTRQQVATATSSSPCQPFWRSLDEPALWKGTEDDALSSSRSCFKALSPTWKVLLLSDGSVTRHLQLMTSSAVQVDCLQMANVGCSTLGLPPGVDAIPGPRVQREVLLRPKVACHGSPDMYPAAGSNGNASQAASINTSASSEPSTSRGSSGDTAASAPGVHSSAPPPLVYACSWWDAAQVDAYLQDKTKPIWVSLSQGHVELYREVQYVYHGHNQHIEELLQCKGPFWGRQYFFWHDGRPLTLIYEVFSPRLEQFLGPSVIVNQ